MLANRSRSRVLAAPFQRRHYRALRNMALVYPRFPQNLARYVFERGWYPYTCAVRTPLGVQRPVLYSHHDLLTLNEVFCREDYRAPRDVRVVVDLGANIGLSALYFLTRNPAVRCHLCEPNPTNVERMRRNLAPFARRISVH